MKNVKFKILFSKGLLCLLLIGLSLIINDNRYQSTFMLGFLTMYFILIFLSVWFLITFKNRINLVVLVLTGCAIIYLTNSLISWQYVVGEILVFAVVIYDGLLSKNKGKWFKTTFINQESTNKQL